MQKPHGQRLAVRRARRIGFEHELERQAERTVEPLAGLGAAGPRRSDLTLRENCSRPGIWLSLRAARSSMMRSSPSSRRYSSNLSARELDRARLAAVADEPDARRVEPQQPRRIHAVASENRLLAGRADDHELLDRPSVARQRFAGEPLADPQVNLTASSAPGSNVDGSSQKSWADSPAPAAAIRIVTSTD